MPLSAYYVTETAKFVLSPPLLLLTVFAGIAKYYIINFIIVLIKYYILDKLSIFFKCISPLYSCFPMLTRSLQASVKT